MAAQTSKNTVESTPVKERQKHLKTAALRAYNGHKTQSAQNERILQHLPMVTKIAHRVVTYLKPPLSFEDLVSAGTVGLIKAARDYDPSHQAEFKTYAFIRIKGAVLDELRCQSSLPANLNKQIQKAFEISRKISGETGASPPDAELADKLGITVDELYQTLEKARAQHFISMDGGGENKPLLGTALAAPTIRPDEQIEQAELVDKLAEAIKQLPQKQRQIILLYYQQHLMMKQIADVLKITESRVSQIHASALFNLSVKLRQWKDDR